MENQMIFERYELKYRITRAQQQELLACMQGYMAPDCYGRSTVRSIYYDTDSFRLIRDSLDCLRRDLIQGTEGQRSLFFSQMEAG